jgi:hypothetical protein
MLILAVAATLPGCGNAPGQQTSASVTVQLPPARPYVPAPAFSFGAAPRQRH